MTWPHNNMAWSHDDVGRASFRGRRSAFTMVELMVVAGIILLLAFAVAPSVDRMWEQRKLSQTETLVRGALLNARNRALGNVETGLFFFVDPTGVQRVYTIEREDEPASARLIAPDEEKYQSVPLQEDDVRNDLVSVHRFRVVEGLKYSLPAPIRVTPNYAVLPGPANVNSDPPASFATFSDAELANNDYQNPKGLDPRELKEPQRHRNFFTIIFSTEGRLVVGRDALIYDEDHEADMKRDRARNVGDLTGLRVEPVVSRYPSGTYLGSGNQVLDLYPPNGDATLAHMVAVDVEGETVAANFPSVKGFLVHDDSVYQRLPLGQHRSHLIKTGRPYYISVATGETIRGAVGETPAS